MVFLYPGFTAEIGEAKERICWEVCKREVTWSCSSWSIYCLSQIFFYGLQERFEWGVRLKTELRGCSLCRGRWYKGMNCLTAGLWLVMGIFYRRVRTPPPPLPAAQNTRPGMQGVAAHFSVPVLGAVGWEPCGQLLLLPLDSPWSQDRGSCAKLFYCPGSVVGDARGKHLPLGCNKEAWG